jgi:hypothetical protein
MAEFRTDIDIANRALQHCGASRIVAFTDDSKNASETQFCYPKVREAELRRNVWTFACRRTMLRAVDTGTMLLDAALYASTTTYFVGSIVADQYNNLWQSTIQSNLANDPLLTSSYWEPYFGPLAVALYDSTAPISLANWSTPRPATAPTGFISRCRARTRTCRALPRPTARPPLT